MLTETKIKQAKPTGKAYRLSDTGNLYLYVTPTGHKSWRLDTKVNNRRKTLVLGSWPGLRLDDARVKAIFIKKDVRSGGYGISSVFRDVAMEWGKTHQANWNDTNKQYRRLVNYVYPHVGNHDVSGIKAKDCLKLLKAIENAGKNETAHRVRNLLSQIFNFAIASDLCEANPTIALKGALKPVKTDHFDAILNEKELGAYIRAVQEYPGTVIIKTALELLPHVAVRPGELRMMKWRDVDFGERIWSYTMGKVNKSHLVPLSGHVSLLLENLQTYTGGHEYCFIGRDTSRYISDTALIMALRRMEVNATPHGFRATFRTLGDEKLGFAPHLLEHQLGHSVKDALGRSYNRTTHLSQRREMMESWSSYLLNLAGLGKEVNI